MQGICRLRWPVRRELATCAFRVAPRLQGSLIYIASRPVVVSDRASPGAPRRLALVPPSLRLPQQLGVGEDGDGADELGLATDVHWS